MRPGPDYIQFYPTMRCNRSCDFCFNRSMPTVPDMSPDAFRAMLAVLGRFSVKTLDIIGGEPTLHPHITTFIAMARDCGLSVNISTNGTNLDVLDEIVKIGGAVTVGISINDRDTLAQAGSFIERHKPVVKTVYSPGMDYGMIDEILSLRPKRFYLIYRDALHAHELAEAVPFHQFLSAVQRRFTPLQAGTVYCSGFLPDSGQYPELGRVRCPAGTTKLGVMPDGSVYPCNLFFGRKELLLGNILTDPFAAGIWNHGQLDFFRTAPRNVCAETSCVLHAKCHGGCPAHGLFLSGDLAAPDPRCGRTASP